MGFEVSFKAINCLGCSDLLWKLVPCFGSYDAESTVAVRHELSSRDFQGQWVIQAVFADWWVLCFSLMISIFDVFIVWCAIVLSRQRQKSEHLIYVYFIHQKRIGAGSNVTQAIFMTDMHKIPFRHAYPGTYPGTQALMKNHCAII